jgi:hypothetical protein
MDIQVKKFIDIYDEESPQDKKIDIYGKKEQITDIFAEETEVCCNYLDSYGYSSR